MAKDYESEARLSTKPKTEASKFLQAAYIYYSLGRFQDTKRCLDLAQGACPNKDVIITGKVDRLRGMTYIETGEVHIAERYLTKGLRSARGETRQLTLARLAVCAKAREDHVASARYRRELSTPRSFEVEEELKKKVQPARGRTRSYTHKQPRARPSKSRSPTRTQQRRPVEPPARVTVIPRWRWNARPTIRWKVKPMRGIDKITIHHTGPPKAFWGLTLGSAATEIQRIQRVHQRDRGWADIGYHYVIDRKGNVWEGRPLKYQGAHAGGRANRGNIGVAVLGDYTHQTLTDAQRRSLIAWLQRLTRRYSVSPGSVYTHNEIVRGGTNCPGKEIGLFVADVRRRLRKGQNLVALKK